METRRLIGEAFKRGSASVMLEMVGMVATSSKTLKTENSLKLFWPKCLKGPKNTIFGNFEKKSGWFFFSKLNCAAFFWKGLPNNKNIPEENLNFSICFRNLACGSFFHDLL